MYVNGTHNYWYSNNGRSFNPTLCILVKDSSERGTFGCTIEPPNKGHFGDDINSADLLFVERLSSLGGSECIVGIILG